ncbi:MAG: PAS domain S-box protein [Syntrophaceae bacterium]
MKFTKPLVVSLLLLLLCVAVLFSVYVQIKRDRINQFNARQMVQARQAAIGIETYFNYLIQSMTLLASDDNIVKLDNQGMDQITGFLAVSAPFLKNVSRVGSSGIIQFSTPARLAGRDVSHRAYFKEITRTHKPVVSDVFNSLPGYRAVSIQVPVFRDGKFDGTVGALLDFDDLAKFYVENLKTEEEGYAWLINSQGTEIHCPVPGHVGKSVFDNCRDFPGIIAMAEKMVRGESGTMTYKYNRLRGKISETLVKQAVYMPVKVGGTFWSIVVATPEDSIVALMADFRNKMLAGAALILLIGCVITYTAVRDRMGLKEEQKRREAEQALTESEARYRSLVNNALTGVFQTTLEGKIIFANQAMAAIFGFDSPEDLIGNNFQSFYRDSGDRKAIVEMLQTSGSCEALIKAVDRQGRALEALVSASFQENIISGMVIDVTAQRRSEQSLKESEARFRILFEQSPFGIAIARDGVTLFVNTTALEMFGYERDQFIGTSQLDQIAPECRDDIIKRYEMRRRGEIPPVKSFETVGLRKDGSKFPLFVHTNEIQLEDGPAVVSFVEDLTFRKQVEDALKESQQRLADIIDFLPDATLVIDREGKVIAWNRAIEEMTGIKAEDMLEKGDYEYALPFYGERRPILIDLALRPAGDFEKSRYMNSNRQGTSLSGEAYMPAMKGGEIYLLGTASVLRDSRGNVVGAIESIRDITERRRAELDLKESQQRLADIIDFLPDATLVIDTEGRVIAWNRAIEEMTGIRAEDMLGKGDYEYALPFYGERRPIVIDLVLAEHKRRDFEKKYISFEMRDKVLFGEAIMPALHGGGVILSATAAVLRDSKGRIVGAIEAIRDITERRVAEERYRSIFENAAEGIFQNTPDGRLLNANPALARIFGFSSPEEMIASINDKSVDFFIDPQVLSEINALLDKQGSVRDFHSDRFRKKDGSSVWLSVNMQAVRDKSGNLMYYEGTCQDMTDRKNLESRLLQAQKMEAIGTMAGGIAHDFNNILASIMGYTELTMTRTYNENLSRYLQQVINACGRAKNLISQILTFSRQQEKEVKPIVIGPLVKEALKLLRASIPSTIEIESDIHPDTRAVFADPIQIHQVIMNLCTNAAYEMRDRGGILGISLRDTEVSGRDPDLDPDLCPGHYVELRVNDTGRGIGKDVINRIFDPFFTTKKKGEGTGLGLSVVYGIVKECGGAITVRSDPGQGSSFIVLLPAIETPPALPENAKEHIPRGTETVLFVDDEVIISEMGRDLLESLGYTVVTFNSAMAALDSFRARAAEFDLVITDMTMPGMTGADLAVEILKIRPGIPIMLCTGYSELISENEAKQLGIREFVMKPYPVKELAQAVRRALQADRVL